MDSFTLSALLRSLQALPRETEWVEFKVDDKNPEDIGEYLSALANAARLVGVDRAYLVWGVEDATHALVGTRFDFHAQKVGGQELESWLTLLLTPRIHFTAHAWTETGKSVVLLDVPAALHTPVRWKNEAYIRVGSYKHKLKDYPEKERQLWRLLDQTAFEEGIARRDVSAEEALAGIDYPAYFDLIGQVLPTDRSGILERLASENLIVRTPADTYDITNLGGILFARKLSWLPSLARKAVRVIAYEGQGRLKARGEFVLDRGYAAGFQELLDQIHARLPVNEVIGQALRREVPMYPTIAIRELVANALIHQDFVPTGESPLVEIFDDRMEITNPGRPLIDVQRFLDEPPRSRNEALAALMRRMNICEERGGGIDKTIAAIETFQLPAPEFSVTSAHTRVTLFAPRAFAEMGRQDRTRACYQHACLRRVFHREMTNASLRERLGLPEKNYSQVSRILADALAEGLIKPSDPDNASRKYARYLPFWA